MPRRRRCCPPGIPVHVIQRGNNRNACFASDSDMAAYARWLYEAAQEYTVDVHAWVFMTNHVHLLVTPQRDVGVSRMMQSVGSRYVRYFNWAHERTGTLFEGRFKSSLVQSENYFLNCQRYIELNPVRAHMVNDPADYVWSSYHAHALGKQAALWTPHPEYLALAAAHDKRQQYYRELCSQKMDHDVIQQIRDRTNTGLVLGDDAFRNQMESLTGERFRRLPRGPKPKRR